ncbi:MAG TPA: VOC family protein [Ruminiclostridium sp.]
MSGNNSKIGGGGFHHLALKVFDFEKTLKFYMEGLGFKKYISWGEGNERAIMLDTGDGNFLEIFAGGSEEKRPEGAFLHVAFRTENCDLAIEQAKAAGAEVTMIPTDVDIQSEPVTKVRIAFCKGPDGEIIEFFQNR